MSLAALTKIEKLINRGDWAEGPESQRVEMIAHAIDGGFGGESASESIANAAALAIRAEDAEGEASSARYQLKAANARIAELEAHIALGSSDDPVERRFLAIAQALEAIAAAIPKAKAK